MLGRIKGLLKSFSGVRESVLSNLSAEDHELVSKIRSERLTYLSDEKLVSLVQTCREIEESNLPGCFLEAGCALGGSAILIASVKNHERPLSIYDVFGMIPPPTEEDTQDVHDRYRVIVEGKSEGLSGDNYYGYEEDLYAVVKSNLTTFGIKCKEQNVSLVKGMVQDTMKINRPVAFAHIDVDWYEPVMVSLKRIFPNLVVGGSIILDDYHDWGGCRKAADEYLGEIAEEFILDDSAGSMKITKIKK